MYFLDSERSDECIDFTMIITSRNNASISNFGGGFRWQSEYPWCIIEFSTESIFLYGCNSKTNHSQYLKFSPNVYVSVIYEHVGKKNLDDQKNLKIKYKVPYELFLFVYSSNFYEICRKREILQVILNVDKNFLAQSKYLKILYKAQFFLLAFEVQILTKIRQNYEYLQIILYI
ncbi:hypothetical protein AGLY_011593 [Aphis glycines]|uniref:Uncharacterized protein n=1 Tax=Aphis glycines TaxID=307491 RepID=A0A6G0TBY8_APHGL|nr:hypothetical protein AGLY_011593 [Aphis glycines]